MATTTKLSFSWTTRASTWSSERKKHTWIQTVAWERFLNIVWYLFAVRCHSASVKSLSPPIQMMGRTCASLHPNCRFHYYLLQKLEYFLSGLPQVRVRRWHFRQWHHGYCTQSMSIVVMQGRRCGNHGSVCCLSNPALRCPRTQRSNRPPTSKAPPRARYPLCRHLQ